MAYRKSCDNCERLVDRSGEPFTQIHFHASLSEQKEHPDGRIEYRYLTEKGNAKLVFCNDECEMEWRAKRRAEVDWREVPLS